jgi:hypothetical protein
MLYYTITQVYIILSPKCLVVAIAEESAWRDVEDVGVWDVLRGLRPEHLYGAMSIRMTVAWAHARPMAAQS